MAKNLNPVEHAVKRLQDGLQEADFDGAYRFLGDLDLDTVTANIDEFSSLRLRCLVAEVRDFFGDYAAAKEAIETVGRASFDKLHESLQLRTETEHAMAKQRIWAAIHLGYVFYRAHHYDKAAEVFTFCERFVREKLVTGSSKCLFTQSRIWYSVGLVHRQNYKYEIAKEAFIKSISLLSLPGANCSRRTRTIHLKKPVRRRINLLNTYVLVR